MRRLLLVLAAVLTLTACGDDEPATPTGPKPWSGGTLATPLAFHQVKEERPGACPPDVDLAVEDVQYKSCLLLEPAEFEIDSLAGVEKKYQQTSWGLVITLEKADAAALGELTTRVVGEGPPRNRVALLIGGRHLVSAPNVMTAITDGVVVVTGTFTQDDVDGLIKRLRG